MDFLWIIVPVVATLLIVSFLEKFDGIEAEKKGELVPGSLRERPPEQPPTKNPASHANNPAAPASRFNPVLLIAGWTLIGAALVLHVSTIEWDTWDRASKITLWFHARDQFKMDARGGTYNVTAAGFWGLFLPCLLVGTAVAVMLRAILQETAEPSPEVKPQPSPPITLDKPQRAPVQPAPAATSRLRPCPDCNRSVSRRAPACPGCGCPLEPDDVCPDCQEFVAKDAAQCPNCGCPLRQESKVAVESPPAGSPSNDTSAPAGFVIDDDDKAESIVDLPAVDEGPAAERPLGN